MIETTPLATPSHETFATGGTALSFADCEERHANLASAKSLYEFILSDPKSASNEARLEAARLLIAALRSFETEHGYGYQELLNRRRFLRG